MKLIEFVPMPGCMLIDMVFIVGGGGGGLLVAAFKSIISNKLVPAGGLVLMGCGCGFLT